MVDDPPEDPPHLVLGEEHEQAVGHHRHGPVATDLGKPAWIGDRRADAGVLGTVGVELVPGPDHVGEVEVIPVVARRRVDPEDPAVEAAPQVQDDRVRVGRQVVGDPLVDQQGPGGHGEASACHGPQPGEIEVEAPHEPVGPGVTQDGMGCPAVRPAQLQRDERGRASAGEVDREPVSGVHVTLLWLWAVAALMLGRRRGGSRSGAAPR
jgi:hypothetical protein